MFVILLFDICKDIFCQNFCHFGNIPTTFVHTAPLFFRILLSDVRKDILLNANQAERQSGDQKSYLKKTAEARKQIIHYENK